MQSTTFSTITKITAIFLTTLFFQPLEAISYVWDVASGDWANGANWTPTGGPPTINDSATINNGGVATVDNGQMVGMIFLGSPSGTDTINVLPPGGVILDFDANIGEVAGTQGTINIAGTWSSDTINAGVNGTGNFVINNGSNSFSVFCNIGVNATGVGNGLIDGAGTQLFLSGGNLVIGNSGQGNLTIQNGAQVLQASTQVAANPGSTGSLVLAGTPGAQGLLNTDSLTTGSSSTSFLTFNGGILQPIIPLTISGFTLATIQSGGAFIDTQTFDISAPQSFTGPGQLVMLGTGSLLLSGLNSYSGGTTITAGTLQGDTNSIPTGNVVDQGTLIFNQTFNGTFAGSIFGSGTFLKQGSGVLQLTGNSANFAGSSTIAAGTLNVNGILGGLLTVNNGTTLSGNGFLGNVTNNGIIAPGNSIGTIHVNNFVNNSTGTYIAEISGTGASDEIVSTGTAVLNGGQLIVTADPGIYLKGTTYTLIDADAGLTGQFSSTILPTNVLVAPSYLPNQLILTVLASTLTTTGLSGNALRVAQYIRDHVDANPDILKITAALNTLDPAQQQKAYDQLTPALFQALAYTVGDTAHMINTTFIDRLNYLRKTSCCEDLCNPRTSGAWIAGTADFIRQSKTQELRRFNTNNEGVALGYDNRLFDTWLAGLGIGYSNSNLHWGNSAGHANINSLYVGVYATQCHDCYFIDATLLGYFNNHRVRRHIHFADIDRTAKNNHDSYGFNPHLGGGMYLDFCSVNMTPFFDLDYYFIQQNRYREHGANSIDLRVKRNQTNLLRVEAGLNLSKSYPLWGGSLQPNVSVSYVGHRLLSGKKYIAAFNGIDANFTSFGTKHCFNQLELGGGVLYVINDHLGVNAWYDIELGRKRQEQEVNLEINYRF